MYEFRQVIAAVVVASSMCGMDDVCLLGMWFERLRKSDE